MERLDRSAFADLKGNAPERWAIIRKANHQIVNAMFSNGHSVNSIAQHIGISRSMVNSILNELGIRRPDVSEGNKRSAAMATDSQRLARSAAAHEATRKMGRHRPTQINHSIRKEASLDYIGIGEVELAEKLIAKGLKPMPQAAVEGYNIDLLCDHLAVEVHNYTTRPSDRTRTVTRIIKLLCRGISIIYLRTGPHFPTITEAAVNQVIAFHDLTSRNPSALGQYRVVRGDGKIDWTAERDLDEIAEVVTTYSALKSG
jgi:transposase